ncbi:MAG: ATP-binding protein [Acidobacteriota bacterium]
MTILPAMTSGMRIRQRLPLLIGGLILGVIIAFSFTSYRGVNDAAFEVAEDRLRSLTHQLAETFRVLARDLRATIQAAAQDPSVRDCIRTPRPASYTAATEVLEPLVPPRDRAVLAVELWNARCERVLAVPQPMESACANIQKEFKDYGGKPDSCVIAPLRPSGDLMIYPVIAAVLEEGQPAGYLVQWRRLGWAEQARELAKLLGTPGGCFLGNDRGRIWSDLATLVPPPPVEVRETSQIQRYRRENNQRVIGLAERITGTPWFVLIELQEEVVLAPGARFLQRVTAIGLVLLAIGLGCAWLLSRRITAPLHSLTAAATAIAGGDYSRTVDIRTGDELEELSNAFNTMVARVRDSRQELESRVRERTAELQERTAELQERNAELDAFAYSISHDLRSPLRHIDGFIDLLQKHAAGMLDEKGNRYLRIVRESSEQMAALIDDLLSFSRMRRAEMEMACLDLDNLVHEVIAELDRDSHGRRVVWNVGKLPLVRADRSMIRQVLLNLLGNALKYTRPREEAMIEVGAAGDAGELRGQVVVFVRDNGVGFDMKYAHKLFGVFQRLHGETEFEGTGIGLANVRCIISRHGGRAWAEGVVDRGATFYFSLPAVEKGN